MQKEIIFNNEEIKLIEIHQIKDDKYQYLLKVPEWGVYCWDQANLMNYLKPYIKEIKKQGYEYDVVEYKEM